MSADPINSAKLIERAFELAKSGTCATITQLARALKAEGFSRASMDLHLSGRSIRKQLRDLCNASRNHSAADVAQSM